MNFNQYVLASSVFSCNDSLSNCLNKATAAAAQAEDFFTVRLAPSEIISGLSKQSITTPTFDTDNCFDFATNNYKSKARLIKIIFNSLSFSDSQKSFVKNAQISLRKIHCFGDFCEHNNHRLITARLYICKRNWTRIEDTNHWSYTWKPHLISEHCSYAFFKEKLAYELTTVLEQHILEHKPFNQNGAL